MQDRAKRAVEAGVKEGSHRLTKVVQLLTGQQIPVAAALVAAGGDVRLAVMIVQVGRRLSKTSKCLGPGCLPNDPRSASLDQAVAVTIASEGTRYPL